MAFMQPQLQQTDDLNSLLASLQLGGLQADDGLALSQLAQVSIASPTSSSSSQLASLASAASSGPFCSVAPSIPIPQVTQQMPACAYPISDSPVSHLNPNQLDMNTMQQLMQLQQAAGVQQIMAGMLAQYQQTQVAAQTQAMLSLLIPMVNLQQGTNTTGSEKAIKNSPNSKKDPKEKYKKPGNKQYKTEMCKTFVETGHCRYGKKCQFAHGDEDMRDSPKHPKFKTIPCETIVNGGSCPYGHRCRFVHPGDEQASAEMFVCQPVATERRLPVFQELAPSLESSSSSSSTDGFEQA